MESRDPRSPGARRKVFPDPTVAGTWEYAVDRGRGVVHVLSAIYPATGNATARFTVTTLGMNGSVQASGTTAEVETGYYLHYSGLALLPGGALLLTGGHERDNFTAVARSLVLQPPSRAPSLSVTLVPAIWIDSPKGTTCTLQFSMHVEGPWTDLAEVLVTNVPQPYVDLAAGAARRFYQVLVKP